MSNPRFIPAKRYAIDGKMWWCVWDVRRNQWSIFLCHGKYRSRRACQAAIDKSAVLIF